MLRKVLAGIAGLIAALAVITFIQLLGHFHEGQEVPGDAGDGNVVDVDLIPLDEEE